MKETLNNVIYRLEAVLRILYLTNAMQRKNIKMIKKIKKISKCFITNSLKNIFIDCI